MRRAVVCGTALAVASLCATGAHAALVIKKAGGTLAQPAEAIKTFNPATGGWNVTLLSLYDPGGWTEYNIEGTGGEVIDNVFIDVPCWESPNGGCMPAGSPVVVRVRSMSSAGVHTVHNIVQLGDAETILNLVNVTHDIGSVTVEAIGDLIAGRDVIGPVVSTTENNPERGITKVSAGRHILGDVLAENGRINLVYAGARVGTEGAPIAIRTRHDLLQVVGLEAVYANIDTRANGGSGRLFALNGGTFGGTLVTEKLFANPFSGVGGQIRFNVAFLGTVTIGKSYTAGAGIWGIELPPNGLEGQIIVNADGAAGGAWSGPVSVGPMGNPLSEVLSAPGYTLTADDIGGGAVGLVPFDLHRSSCSPPSGSSVVESAEPLTVKLRHYGPIALTSNTPLAFQRRPLGSLAAFGSIPSNGFVVSLHPDDPRSLVVTAAPGATGFEGGYEYRITATSTLKCNVPALPAVAWTNAYTAIVEDVACPADLDSNGGVGFGDLILVLSHWGPCKACPWDLDSNGAVSFTDLVEVLVNWGPCG